MMIRKAKKEDIDNIYQLICILEEKQLNKDYFIKTYNQGINDSYTYYYVYEEGQILGFISFYIHHYLHHDNNTGEIVELVVSPQARGQKIDHQLLTFIEKLAKEKSLEEIELCTSTYRKKAHHFYENHGFIMNHYNYIKKL